MDIWMVVALVASTGMGMLVGSYLTDRKHQRRLCEERTRQMNGILDGLLGGKKRG